MCDKCGGFSRRELLKGIGLGLAAACLWGCESDGLTEALPDAYSDHLLDGGPPVRINPKEIVTLPPVKPQATEYGFIMPRSAWTRMPLEVRNANPMGGVNKLTIHHSGDGKPFMGESAADVARHLQVVQQAHLQRGMIDIGYHFAVDRVGRVWQLRWLAYEGQHVRMSANGTRNNLHNIGVVVLGDFDVQPVSVPQRDRLCELVRLIRTKYALPATAAYMHGEIVDTDCPGKALKPLIVDARKRNML